jgi:hypothetical protein
MVPGLQKLDIEWDPLRTEAPGLKEGPPTVIHGELKSLCCSFEAITTYISSFQGAIICPSLESFTLKTLPFVTPPTMRGWTAFFNTVTPFPLRKFTLPAIHPDSVDHLLQIFRMSPNLSHLYLTGPAVEQLVGHLVVDIESSPVITLPFLTFIDIRNAHITDATLHAFVLSRSTSAAVARGVSKVTVVNLYECPSISPGAWKVVQDLLVS